MIYSHLDARLGNLMFEIAAGISLASRMGVPFKAIADNKWGTLDYIQPFRETIFRKITFQENLPEDVEVYHQPTFAFTPLPAQKDLIISGGFQSEKYFNEDLVRSLFEIDEETNSYIRTKYSYVLKKNPVCIHVRRGDYLSCEDKHPVCRMSYFNKAISLFPQDTIFLVVSADIKWCKDHFKGERFYFVDDESPLIDLYLQTMCKHNIISNSTFSWWGAWLNPNQQKKIIYPTPWFGPFSKINTKDLCPDNWIVVPGSGKVALYYFSGYCILKRIIRKICRVCHIIETQNPASLS